MTKSTITREQLLEIIETDHVQCGEASYLARMALAAMDGEPVAWLLSGGGTKNVVCFDSGNAYADPLREVTPLYRHAQPALVIPDEMTAEQAYEIGHYYGDPVNVFARGANWMRQHIIDSTLAAAQHDTPALNSVQSVVTVPGKWIPVSERMPEVGDIVLTAMGGVVNVGETECSAANCRFFTSVISGRELPATHWMQLPAAPQEVGDA
ncbi:DUF551 domain-containing protein [Klebsiella variicola]|uniref:DUF551 domain-containing protein n=1 Tax=Klebsiella variicola TaxID=244366 RepID=UPI00218126D8|nr:hypothetical protein NUKP41_04930 [Klebsiella variicola]HCI9083811.1 DUF551 domain-containing protein [Klebsiella variicola]